MKLYVIRHGETLWNAERRLQGASDTELNENGIRLAKQTGQALMPVPFDICFTSPLKRARMTAKLALGGRDIPIVEDARIQEISFGVWEGVEQSLLPADMLNNFFHHPENYIPPEGGERIEEIKMRTRDFWQEILLREDLQDKIILIASHGCAVRALLQNVYENPTIENFWRGCVPPNCSMNIVEVKDGKAVLTIEDCVL